MHEHNTETEGIWLVIAIAISGVATIADEFVDGPWFKALKIGGLIVSVCLAIYRVRSYKPFVRYISLSDWTSAGTEVEHRITASEHRRGTTPSIRCEVRDGDHYAECMADVSADANGNVRIGANTAFEARVTIRR